LASRLRMARRFGSAIVANEDSISRIYLDKYISVNGNNATHTRSGNDGGD